MCLSVWESGSSCHSIHVPHPRASFLPSWQLRHLQLEASKVSLVVDLRWQKEKESRDPKMATFADQALKRAHRPLSHYWPELRRKTTPSCKEPWETLFSHVPRKKRKCFGEELAIFAVSAVPALVQALASLPAFSFSLQLLPHVVAKL